MKTNMVLYNTKYKTHPIIVHNPTAKTLVWHQICNLASSPDLQPNRLPNNLTVVTWNIPGLLEKILDLQKVKFLVLGRGQSHWTNKLKYTLLWRHLPQINTEFILGLDCYDVVVVNELAKIIDKFKKHKCKLLFNAGVGPYPECYRKIERKMCKDRPFCHLNGGAFIGYKKYLIINVTISVSI